jgi:hypothetical protein
MPVELFSFFEYYRSIEEGEQSSFLPLHALSCDSSCMYSFFSWQKIDFQINSGAVMCGRMFGLFRQYSLRVNSQMRLICFFLEFRSRRFSPMR